MKSDKVIALIGNPNSGKTTLFNHLTGARQHVGNWPGVTVERKSGFFTYQEKNIEVVDLPGVYTLSHFSQSAMDEEVARQYILSNQADVLVNVLDAANLERHLYLTAQLLEMQVPMILAVNMMDVLDKKGYQLDIERLAQRLGCPVIPLTSYKGHGIDELKKQSIRHPLIPINRPIYSLELEEALKSLINSMPRSMSAKPHALYYAIRQLEENAIEGHWQEDPDIMIASTRYTWAHELAKDVLCQTKKPQQTITPILDKFILNRFLGIPIFLGVIYLMFLFAIHVGGIFQDFFDLASDALFVHGLAHGLQFIEAPPWLIAILAAGVGKGLNTTLSFIPVLAAMFFCLSFLEASGYMARAAFVMDRVMRTLGLPGKSLVPMIVGFGCNVPAIMGARTLDDPRDRILTIMMSPFMSCSARLAIFSVFVAAFFPTGGQNVVFLLYMTGITMAILTGALLRKTLLKGNPSPWIMEIPAYHIPTWKALIFPTLLRTQHFLFRAGKIIVPVCMLLGILNSLTLNGHFTLDDANQHSLLSVLGRALTPIFSPMGITQENWPATVGLMTGTLAKEVVVATLNTLYVQAGHLSSAVQQVSTFDLLTSIKEAFMTIPEHIKELPTAILHPILVSVPNSEVSSGVYGEMVTRFVSTHAAFAYLLFVLLYIPCASTMAAIRKELSTRWMVFSILWSTVLAYGVAVLYYQSTTLFEHPVSSVCWFLGIILIYMGVLKIMANKALSEERKNVTGN